MTVENTSDLIAHYDYQLPEELIAREPVSRRDASRLLLVDRRAGTVTHHHFQELPDLLSPADLFIVNDTRVLPAQLSGLT